MRVNEEYDAWEDALEKRMEKAQRTINKGLDELLDAATERWDAAYASDYAQHVFEDWQDKHTRPTHHSGYQKKPIPNGLRTRVFERDNYRCRACGDWHDLRADHIIPESKGGPTVYENLQTLCARCNSRKGARI